MAASATDRADRPAVRRNGRRTARAGPCPLGRCRFCRSPPDGRRSDARWFQIRGCGGRRQHARPRYGNARRRPDRSTPIGCAAARTAARGSSRGLGRCGRGPRAKSAMLSLGHRFITPPSVPRRTALPIVPARLLPVFLVSSAATWVATPATTARATLRATCCEVVSAAPCGRPIPKTLPNHWPIRWKKPTCAGA